MSAASPLWSQARGTLRRRSSVTSGSEAPSSSSASAGVRVGGDGRVGSGANKMVSCHSAGNGEGTARSWFSGRGVEDGPGPRGPSSPGTRAFPHPGRGPGSLSPSDGLRTPAWPTSSSRPWARRVAGPRLRPLGDGVRASRSRSSAGKWAGAPPPLISKGHRCTPACQERGPPPATAR